MILCDKICEEQAFPHFLSTSNFGYNTPQDIAISPARYSIILDDPLAKIKYAIHIEFARKGHTTCTFGFSIQQIVKMKQLHQPY